MQWEVILTAVVAAVLGAGGVAPVIVAYMVQRRQANLDANSFASENYKQVLQRITALEFAERDCIKEKERLSLDLASMQGRLEELETLRREVNVLREQIQTMKWDAETIHIECNPEAIIQIVEGDCQQLLGWTADELVGKSIEVLMPKYARVAHRSAFQEACKEGHTTRNVQLRDTYAVIKSGTTIPVTIVLNSYEQNGEKFFDAEIHRRTIQ
tara:strand:+ start:535 stop:1173 length:639 start_codon:yes stop_codon:yes gene_type:complete